MVNDSELEARELLDVAERGYCRLRAIVAEMSKHRSALVEIEIELSRAIARAKSLEPRGGENADGLRAARRRLEQARAETLVQLEKARL